MNSQEYIPVTFIYGIIYGIGEISFKTTQGVTADVKYTSTDDVSTSFDATIRIPGSYNGEKDPTTVTLTSDSRAEFDEPDIWTQTSQLTYALTFVQILYVTDIQFNAGSLDVTFTDVNNNPIEKFVAIPGRLDTPILNNGGYANAGVEGIFNKLKNYLYPESIFDNILNKLPVFFTSDGLTQDVTERIFLLNNELIAGKININQFNELVKKNVEDIASQYGSNYEKNYTAVNAAINKYKYLLEN